MKTLVWDVDDVLNDLMRAWLEDRAAQGQTDPSAYGRLTRNPPHELLGMSRSDYLASLDDFRLSGKATALCPLPDVLDWFCRHGVKCVNIALTAVPLAAAHVSAQWVMKHFGRWIRSFNIVATPRPADPPANFPATKAEFLRWWGRCDLLIDDCEENCAAAGVQGIRAVLFPRPWNSSTLAPAEALRLITDFLEP